MTTTRITPSEPIGTKRISSFVIPERQIIHVWDGGCCTECEESVLIKKKQVVYKISYFENGKLQWVQFLDHYNGALEYEA